MATPIVNDVSLGKRKQITTVEELKKLIEKQNKVLKEWGWEAQSTSDFVRGVLEREKNNSTKIIDPPGSMGFDG